MEVVYEESLNAIYISHFTTSEHLPVIVFYDLPRSLKRSNQNSARSEHRRIFYLPRCSGCH